MDFRERLNRLLPIPLKKEESKLQIINDLRKRLERVLRTEKIIQKKETFPIEGIIKGKIVSTQEGNTFVVDQYFYEGFKLGEMSLNEILRIPMYPAHLLYRDERFKDLDLKKALFLDTETTGLSGGTGTFVFLIGLGYFEDENFKIKQFFMRDFSEEKATLLLFNEILESFKFLVTFNGKQYDIPLLETRFILSRIPTRIRNLPNLDLLYPSRKIWRGAYENCRLITLESRLLGIEREDDIPSELIPSMYIKYLHTRDGRIISKVFYHNQMDILSMVTLLGRIHLIYHDPQATKPRKGIEHFSLGRLFWDHGEREKAIPCFEAALKQCDDELAWEVMKWLSIAFKKLGQLERAKLLWEDMLGCYRFADVYPYIELAKYYEHHLKDFDNALKYVNQALNQVSSNSKEIELLIKRKERLEAKKSGLRFLRNSLKDWKGL